MQWTLAIQAYFDVGRSLGVAAGTDGVLVVIHDLQFHRQ